VTRLVHGEAGLSAAARITEALFSGNLSDLTETDFEQLRMDGLPASDLQADSVGLVEVLVDSGLATSNRAAREFITAGAVAINGEKIVSEDHRIDRSVAALYNKYVVIKRGKKLFHLIRFQ